MAQTIPEPFQVVLTRLKERSGRSYREIAEATAKADPEGKGLSPTRIAQLLKGGDPPAPRALELLAAALNQQPGVFIEYQLAQARSLFDERGPGGLQAAAWALEYCRDRLPLRSGKPAPRSARRLAA